MGLNQALAVTGCRNANGSLQGISMRRLISRGSEWLMAAVLSWRFGGFLRLRPPGNLRSKSPTTATPKTAFANEIVPSGTVGERSKTTHDSKRSEFPAARLSGCAARTKTDFNFRRRHTQKKDNRLRVFL